LSAHVEQLDAPAGAHEHVGRREVAVQAGGKWIAQVQPAQGRPRVEQHTNRQIRAARIGATHACRQGFPIQGLEHVDECLIRIRAARQQPDNVTMGNRG